MLKYILALGVACMALNSQADIDINWFADGGFYVNGSGPNPADPGDYIGAAYGSYTVQLIWTPDDQISGIDPSNVAGSFVAGGELALATFVLNNPYGDYTGLGNEFFDANYGGVALHNGWVYSRVFGTDTPIVGDYYHASAVLEANLYDPVNNPVPSQTLNQNQNPTGPFNSNELNLEIVPEPSVLAFLGLGGLLMALRRKRA